MKETHLPQASYPIPANLSRSPIPLPALSPKSTFPALMRTRFGALPCSSFTSYRGGYFLSKRLQRYEVQERPVASCKPRKAPWSTRQVVNWAGRPDGGRGGSYLDARSSISVDRYFREGCELNKANFFFIWGIHTVGILGTNLPSPVVRCLRRRLLPCGVPFFF